MLLPVAVQKSIITCSSFVSGQSNGPAFESRDLDSSHTFDIIPVKCVLLDSKYGDDAKFQGHFDHCTQCLEIHKVGVMDIFVLCKFKNISGK